MGVLHWLEYVVMKQVYVFLDFDGCMHPFFPEAFVEDWENKYFSYAPNLEKCIHEMNAEGYDIKLVISSSWRYKPMEELRSYFPDSIKDLIVGVNPKFAYYYVTGTEYNREDECRQYLTDNQLVVPWFSLDDDKDIYYTPEKLLLCPNHFKANEMELFKEMVRTCQP